MYLDLVPTTEMVVKEHLKGKVAVAFDVLRATTTIVTALAEGATSVVPISTPEEAILIAAVSRGGDVLGGERGGEKIPGFHLGNSPLEYTSQAVGGKKLLFTTSNGTRLLLNSRHAERVFVGSLVNSGALAARLAVENHPVILLCAGTKGGLAVEDMVAAGSIAYRLGAKGWDLSDWALTARSLYADHRNNLWGLLKMGSHGQALLKLGFKDDLEFCSQENRYRLVPEYLLGEIKA